MDAEYYKSLIGYKSAMAQARIMVERGLLTPAEYVAIETNMCERFGINFRSLYRENEWIYTQNRGNMSPTKEVI